jgi:hypothetical protein
MANDTETLEGSIMQRHATRFWMATLLMTSLAGAGIAQTPPPADPPVATQSAPPATESGSYDIKLRELEERVVDLKEKVFKSKTRLMLLREQLLHNAIAEAGAVIIHENDMGVSFTLEQVLYTLDGDRIFFQDNRDGSLDDQKSIPIFNGILPPGDHILGVEMTFRGDGTLFSYIDGYQFKVRSTYSFVAAKGRILRIRAIGYERGGMTTRLDQKPFVRFETQQFKYSRENQRKATDGSLGDAPEDTDILPVGE